MHLCILNSLFFLLLALTVPAFADEAAEIDDSSQEADLDTNPDDTADINDRSQQADLDTDAPDRASITDESQAGDIEPQE
jgi:hypothetical protein